MIIMHRVSTTNYHSMVTTTVITLEINWHCRDQMEPRLCSQQTRLLTMRSLLIDSFNNGRLRGFQWKQKPHLMLPYYPRPWRHPQLVTRNLWLNSNMVGLGLRINYRSGIIELMVYSYCLHFCNSNHNLFLLPKIGIKTVMVFKHL